MGLPLHILTPQTLLHFTVVTHAETSRSGEEPNGTSHACGDQSPRCDPRWEPTRRGGVEMLE